MIAPLTNAMLKEFLLTTLILLNLIRLAYAGFKPNDVSLPRTDAQGTRGCPVRLGNLTLFGIRHQEQLTLDITKDSPMILYQVTSEGSEKVLVSLTQVDGTFKRQQVYYQVFNVDSEDYISLKLLKLEENRDYLLTLVLLCQDRPQYGKSIRAWINFVDNKTQVNSFIESRFNEINQNTP